MAIGSKYESGADHDRTDAGQDSTEQSLTRSQPLTIAALEHWVLFGASWAVVESSAGHVLIQLCTCTGEPVERLQTRDPAVIAYVREASGARD